MPITSFLFSFQPESEWASALHRDQGQSSDASMAKFDGQTGVSIPSSLIESDAFPTHKFTIATWMRHRHNKAQDKHTKEHIICKADDHRKLSTKTFSLFLFPFLHSALLLLLVTDASNICPSSSLSKQKSSPVLLLPYIYEHIPNTLLE